VVPHVRSGLNARGRAALIAGAALLLFAAATALQPSGVAVAAPAMAMLSRDVLPDLAASQDLGPANSEQSLAVTLAVPHDLAALYRAEAALYDPKSASFHHFLTPSQFRARFGAPASQVAAIRAFATSHGLRLVNPDVLYDNVAVWGTVAQVDAAFGVAEHVFRSPDGTRFIANRSAPQVPAALGINSITGLETRDRVQTSASTQRPAEAAQEQTCVADPASDTGNVCTAAFDPQDLWSMYDQPADNLGQGQTVAIMGAGQAQDVIDALREFEATRHLPQVSVFVYHTDPGAASIPESGRDDSGRVEWELDTQSVTGMAPDLAQLRLYFASATTVQGIATDIETWAGDPGGPLQANASVGIQENNPVVAAISNQMMAATAQAAMEGRTLFASTGDVGAGCAYPLPGLNGITFGLPVDCYPAVDPNVVGVGGTVLYSDGAATNPQREHERAWDHTGGAPSHFFAQPAYQSGVTLLQANVCVSQPDGMPYPNPGQLCRGISDVAALSGDISVALGGTGGPVDGYDMVDATCSFDSSGNETCTYTDDFPEGGTSLSSPLWAGMWARVQAHHDIGNASANSLGFANPLLYQIGESSTYANDFFDVIEGANDKYSALPGWDYPTGWGVPQLSGLIKDVTHTQTTAALSNALPQGGQAEAFVAGPSPPTCEYSMWDPTSDATDAATGLQEDQLDITQLTFGLTPDKTKLRVVFTIKDLNQTVPAPWTTNQYQAWWSVNGGSTLFAVDAEVSAAGPPRFSDGTFAIVSAPVAGSQYQFVQNPSSTATGTFGSGPGGQIEVDAPLSEIGSPNLGDALTQPFATTAEVSGASSATQGFLIDLDGPGSSYKLGDTTCLDVQNQPVVPETPGTALLAMAGAGLAGAGLTVRHRRRRRQRNE
jgi:pseudomonalisin